MLFVFASHFAEVYFAPSGESARGIFREITLIASPTFMTITGVLIGFLWRTRLDSFPALRRRLIDRGIFLLTAGHLLIAGSYLAGEGWYTHLGTPAVFITDVIGLCMIAMPWIVNRVSKVTTVSVGLLGICASWFAAFAWHPTSMVFDVIKEALVGTMQPRAHLLAFPVLPWFSLNLIATALGRLMGERFLEGDEEGMSVLLLSVGTASIGAGLLLKGLYLAGRQWLHDSIWYSTRSLFQKYPPSPAYFLFYGGLGVSVILAGSLWAERHRFRIVSSAAKIGQTSLMMFVLQSYIYYTGLYLIRGMLVQRVWWPVAFVTSIPLVLVPAYFWHRHGMNRFITVGYYRGSSETSDEDTEALAEKATEVSGLGGSLTAPSPSRTNTPQGN